MTTPSDSATLAASGLSSERARAQLLVDGPNELGSDAATGFWHSAFEVVREPMLLLLLAAGGIYLVLGSARDALTLLFAVAAMIGMALFQKRKTEHAVSRLKQLSAPQARVVRDGREQAIATAEVVQGDVVLLREGDRIAADAALVSSSNLRVDESLLTGESVPVDKLPGEFDQPLLPPESGSTALVYAGTLVVQGHGACVVRATGARSAMGRIGMALTSTQPPASPLQLEVRRMVRVIAILGGLLCALLAVVYGLSQHDATRGLLAGITLAMSILPEEMPVVLAVFTTLGAFRISKFQVLARRAEAVEALGSATVLCVDKTGTITENRMRIAVLAPIGGADYEVVAHAGESLPEEVHELLEYGVLASQPASPDGMERAFHSFGEAALHGTEHLRPEYTREQEYPLTRDMLAVSHLFRAGDTSGHVVAAKGAPEAVADLCHLDAQASAQLLERATAMAKSGLRVLAVARARYEPSNHPTNQHDFDFAVLGLVGLEDPVRASVPAATAAFRRAGVRVVMITGDHADTARAIARKAGLDVGAGVLTGAELGQLGERERNAAVAHTNVFARCNPEHKLQLIHALTAAGELVAMTGDGVNDAPALKAAHIGIAMGVHGTDVAREAAALVLATEDFGAIAQAIVVGRRVLANLRKAMTYVVAVHVPIAGMALAPVLLGMPAMLLPVHLVFLELVIDPACTIALEAEEPDEDLAGASPSKAGRSLLARSTLLRSVVQGFALFGAVFAVYAVSLSQGQTTNQARAAGFISIVVGNLALILVQRSSTRSALATLLHAPNPIANLLSSLALLVLAATLAVPGLRTVFYFALPPTAACVGAVIAALAGVLWYDLWKSPAHSAAAQPGGGASP